MAQYTVQLPDGQTMTLEGPDGASDADVIAQAQQLIQQKRPGERFKQPVIDRSGALANIDSVIRGVANGFTAGLADPIAAGVNAVIPVDRLLGEDVSSVWDGTSFSDALNQNLSRERAINEADANENGFLSGVGNVVGAIGSPLSKLVSGSGIWSALANSGIYGALQGGVTAKENVGGGLLRGAAEGVAGDLVGRGIGGAVGRVAAPVTSKAVKRLREAGVPLTLGQIVGGPVKGLEDKLTSIPGVGDLIIRGRRKSIEGFNRAAVNEALSPIGGSLPTGRAVGRDAAAYAQGAASDAYDRALTSMNIQADPQLQQDLTAAAAKGAGLPDAQRQFFDSVMTGDLGPFMQGRSAMSGADLQAIKRGLDQRLASLRKPSASPADELGIGPLEGVQDAVMGAAQRQNPELFDDYINADAAYSRVQRINDATARMRSDKEFTPLAFAGAVAKRGYGTTTPRVAAGQANMQDLADAASEVLPSQYPDSGSIGRGLISGLLLGGASAISPQGAAVAAASALPYVPGVDRLVESLIAGERPAAIRGLGTFLRSNTPSIGRIGGIVGAQQGRGE